MQDLAVGRYHRKLFVVPAGTRRPNYCKSYSRSQKVCASIFDVESSLSMFGDDDIAIR